MATYGQRGSYALSPDGSFLAYRVGGGVLMIRRWSELEPLAVAGVEAMVQPTGSPDGRHVAFAQAEQIRVAPISGGPMRTLATGGWPYWGRDGYIYMSEVPGPGSTGPIVRVPEAGGPHERVSQLVGEDFGHQLVHILPDGRRALMVARVEGGDREIRVLQLDTGEMRILTGGRNARYSETGHMVYLTPDGTLMADVLDTDAVELAGRPIIIADGVEAFSMSENGTLFYSLFSGARTEFVWVTRTGVATPDHPGWTFNAGGGNPAWSLSPDGTRVAMRAITDENEDIWIKELGGGPNSRLTFDESQDWSPHWTPDGETVTFVSIRAGDRDVWTKRADGTGVAELLYDHEKRIVEALWSRDGKWLVLRGGALGAAAGTRDILAMRWGVDAKARPLIAEPYDEREPALSPDSRWISYVSNETGSNEVFLRPFPDVNAGRWQVSNSGGSMPVWANSGRELFFVDSDRLLVAVEIAPESDSSPVRDRQPLFTLPPEFRVSQNNTLYGVAPDDDRFLWARTNEEGDAGSRFILVQNFDEELKRLVPN